MYTLQPCRDMSGFKIFVYYADLNKAILTKRINLYLMLIYNINGKTCNLNEAAETEDTLCSWCCLLIKFHLCVEGDREISAVHSRPHP